MAHAARIICGAVSQCVKIGGRTVQPSACVRYRNKIVTVVTGGLVAVIEVCIVAVDTHLGFVSIEGFMLCRGLPVGVTAPWRRALGAVLAEVTIEADVSGPVGRLCGIVAHTAGIVRGAVGKSVKIGCGTVQPSACVRYGDGDVTVVAGRSVPEAVVGLMTRYTNAFFR